MAGSAVPQSGTDPPDRQHISHWRNNGGDTVCDTNHPCAGWETFMTRARGDVIAQENRPVTSNRKALWRLPACIAIAVGILAAHTLSGYLSGLQWLTLSSFSPDVR